MGRPRGWASRVTGRPTNVFAGSPDGGRARRSAAVSGRRSREGSPARTPLPRPACRRRWGAGGSATVAACQRSVRRRCPGCYLSFAEREEIAIRHGRDCGLREIARRLGRNPSTISRELRRNAATRGGCLDYRATNAQWRAERRARRPKVAKLAAHEALHRYVQERLSGAVKRPDGTGVDGPTVRWIGRRRGRRHDRRWAIAWSPEQIARRLPVDFPDDESMRISHEAIYQALYVQGRGALRRELSACLRTGRALRVPRARTKRGKGFVTDEVMIRERPAEVADRAVPGHWEGDLIRGLRSSAIGTLVERTTRFTILLHLPPLPGHGEARVKNGPPLAGHGAEALRDAITAAITTLPEQLRRSLTWDQGAEMAKRDGHARWPSTSSCASPPDCRSTSVTRTAPGSAAATRTPTGCCAGAFEGHRPHPPQPRRPRR